MLGASSEQQPQRVISDDLHQVKIRYKLAPTTFKALCSVPERPDRRAVLEKACAATEFQSFPIKQSERGFFRYINEQTPIPYLVRETVGQAWHKAFLLVQIDLMKTGWPNKLSAAARKDLMRDRGHIYSLLDRVLRCIIDIFGQRMDGRGVNVALDVLRSVKAGVWEGNDTELLQVEGIGTKKMEKLVQAGIKNIRQLSNLEFYHIERLLSRNPPFGQQLRHQLAGFPLLRLKLDVFREFKPPFSPTQGATSASTRVSTWIAQIVLGYDNERVPHWDKGNPCVTLVIEGEDGRLVWFWRGSVKKLEGGKEIFICLDAPKGEQLKVAFACEGVVGTMLRGTFTL